MPVYWGALGRVSLAYGWLVLSDLQDDVVPGEQWCCPLTMGVCAQNRSILFKLCLCIGPVREGRVILGKCKLI